MAEPKEPTEIWARTLEAVDAMTRLTAGWISWGTAQIADAIDPKHTKPKALPAAPPQVEPAPLAPQDPGEDSLREKMQHLQRRAIEQSTNGSEVELFHRILDQLVPDEARIVGALSDGSTSALVHVRGRNRSVTLENASLIARTANLALPRLGPTYIGNLLSLGLLEIGPEDDSHKEDYQILMAETWILKAIKAGAKGPIPARIEKGTIRLSALGHRLWVATMSDGA